MHRRRLGDEIRLLIQVGRYRPLPRPDPPPQHMGASGRGRLLRLNRRRGGDRSETRLPLFTESSRHSHCRIDPAGFANRRLRTMACHLQYGKRAALEPAGLSRTALSGTRSFPAATTDSAGPLRARSIPAQSERPSHCPTQAPNRTHRRRQSPSAQRDRIRSARRRGERFSAGRNRCAG